MVGCGKGRRTAATRGPRQEEAAFFACLPIAETGPEDNDR
jgi:hypothetical protein